MKYVQMFYSSYQVSGTGTLHIYAYNNVYHTHISVIFIWKGNWTSYSPIREVGALLSSSLILTKLKFMVGRLLSSSHGSILVSGLKVIS